MMLTEIQFIIVGIPRLMVALVRLNGHLIQELLVAKPLQILTPHLLPAFR
jgi:hypothetical protein